MQIKVDVQVGAFARGMRDQLPFASARALTQTARAARDDLSKAIEQKFDSPTPWIKGGTFSTSASKDSLQAWVGVKDTGARVSQAKWIKEHFGGGARGSKPMELAMQAMGILPAGWLAVPSKDGVRKDAYGNVPKVVIARVLTAIRNKEKAKRGADSFRVIVVKPNDNVKRSRHLSPGIWSISKVGTQTIVKPVFLFVERAAYRERMDLPDIVGTTVAREFDARLAAALASVKGSQ